MIILLVLKRPKEKADYFLSVWIFLFLFQLIFYEISISYFPIKGSGAIWSFYVVLLNAPFLYFYVKLMVGRRLSLSEFLYHLSPYLIFSGILAWANSFYLLEVEAFQGYLQIRSGAPGWINLYAVPTAISAIIYTIWNLLLVIQHQTKVKDTFAFKEKISLNWIKYLVIGNLFLTAVVMFVIFSATQFNLFPMEKVFPIVASSISALIFFGGVFGFRQSSIFFHLPSFQQEPVPKVSGPKQAEYKKSGLQKSEVSRLAKQVLDYMEKEEAYLDEDLSLPRLAKSLNRSTAQISQLINQEYQQNFYDFVNTFRVKKAEKMLLNPAYDHYTVLGIGLECGFKSKSSYHRAFKKFTGKSPSQYRKEGVN